jgi:hypothetical protein
MASFATANAVPMFTSHFLIMIVLLAVSMVRTNTMELLWIQLLHHEFLEVHPVGQQLQWLLI